MVIEMEHQTTGKAPLKLIANPIKMGKLLQVIGIPPPLLGEHTRSNII